MWSSGCIIVTLIYAVDANVHSHVRYSAGVRPNAAQGHVPDISFGTTAQLQDVGRNPFVQQASSEIFTYPQPEPNFPNAQAAVPSQCSQLQSTPLCAQSLFGPGHHFA